MTYTKEQARQVLKKYQKVKEASGVIEEPPSEFWGHDGLREILWVANNGLEFIVEQYFDASMKIWRDYGVIHHVAAARAKLAGRRWSSRRYASC